MLLIGYHTWRTTALGHTDPAPHLHPIHRHWKNDFYARSGNGQYRGHSATEKMIWSHPLCWARGCTPLNIALP